ncbi:hypothetical protein AB5I41_04770 [Sphingomonas sp. MMS24-JH45]
MTAAAMAVMALSADDGEPQIVPGTTPAFTPAPDAAALAPVVAQWKVLQQTDALPFDSYANFLAAHPGWPNQAAIRRTAEKKAADGTAAPTSVATFCRRMPPLTAAGWVACARAFTATGASGEANAAARAAWRMGSLSAQDEGTILSYYLGALSPADHDRRMDALLWAGQTGAATRQLAYVSPAARPLLAARLAFRTNAFDAGMQAASNDAAGMRDAGYIADKATWWRSNGGSGNARSWLARARTGMTAPGNVEKFYQVLPTNARAAAADGQWQTAYDIARQVDDAYPYGTDVSTKPYGERDDYTSLAWLAGQTALTKIGRPADAMVMFEKYGAASQAPQTRAKGYYWAGSAPPSAPGAARRRHPFSPAPPPTAINSTASLPASGWAAPSPHPRRSRPARSTPWRDRRSTTARSCARRNIWGRRASTWTRPPS